MQTEEYKKALLMTLDKSKIPSNEKERLRYQIKKSDGSNLKVIHGFIVGYRI